MVRVDYLSPYRRALGEVVSPQEQIERMASAVDDSLQEVFGPDCTPEQTASLIQQLESRGFEVRKKGD